MKRTLLLLLCCMAICFQLIAQKIDYALKGGLNLNFASVKVSGRTYSGSGLGIHGGLVGNIQLAPDITLQPGALLTLKRFKVDDLNGIQVNHVSVDIPVVALYEKDNFFAGIGPNFNIGLSGNYKFADDKYNLYDDSNTGRFSIKRIEVALNIMAGYKLKNELFFAASYIPGLVNLFNHSSFAGSDTEVRTSLIAVSVGYPLRKL